MDHFLGHMNECKLYCDKVRNYSTLEMLHSDVKKKNKTFLSPLTLLESGLCVFFSKHLPFQIE